jgi:hypothetical protein
MNTDAKTQARFIRKSLAQRQLLSKSNKARESSCNATEPTRRVTRN